MSLTSLRAEIASYVPFTEEEVHDKSLILSAIDGEKDILTRRNRLAHLTASAWVVNPARDKVLLCYHKIYHSWSWLGGHADGESDLLSVAIREVKEESGLEAVSPVLNNIFSLEVLTVDGHVKNGSYVSSHLHLNVTYLLEADDKAPLKVKPDENAGLKWVGLEEVYTASSEPWFIEHVYKKLNRKLSRMTKATR